MGTPLSGSVLVVDDDPAVFSAFRRAARRLKVRLRFATAAKEALDLIQAEVPELVISAFRLPGIDGLELIRRIRATHPEVQCVLHTSDLLPPASGGLDVPILARPCSEEDLRELLEAATTA